MKDGSSGRRRVVVTGMGAVTPIGLDVAEMWTSMRAGRCGIGPIENRPTEDLYIKIAGEIRGFDPAKHVKSRKIQYGDRYSWLAGRAADEAWTQSGLATPFDKPYRAASIIGSGAGGFSTIESAYRDLFVHHKKATNPLTLLRIIGSSASAHVGIEYGIKGPTFATCSACSTATHAIGIGLDYIRNGVVDVAVTGASEAVLTYGSMRVWQAMRVLSPDGCFPFSKRRNGTVLSEGAGILVLEELEHAKARGATILAE
ncbi:MAG: beta-ketoacyl synthase, partial [Hyphomicrobiaceae bacterium]